MYCANHVVRNLIKALNKYHVIKRFNKTFVKSNKKRFLQIVHPQYRHCHCGDKHDGGDCGCLKPVYHNTVARHNFHSALIQSGKSPETLAQHARDEHTEYTFCKKTLCSCGKCKGKEELDCKGKEYHTRHPIKCPMHSLAFEIECHYRASQAEKLIHPILGMGYTNQNEASHNVFIRYRAKTYHMERLHYIVSTNLGLLQSNMTYMFKEKGPGYHWILELFNRLNLPLFDGMKEAVVMANTDCMKKIEKSREKQTKTERVRLLMARKHEQAECQRWGKQQTIVHTYGKQDGSKSCKCGSTTHEPPAKTVHSERSNRVARVYGETMTFQTTVIATGRILLTLLVGVVVTT